MDIDQVKVLDKTFVKSIQHEQIQSVIARMAADLDRDFMDKKPLFISVLNGSFIFTADLFKQLQLPCTISFVKLASYVGDESSGEVRRIFGLSESIENRSVIILEDIIDSGLTMQKFLAELKHLKPAEIKIASLLFKPDSFKGKFKIDYIGMSIPNDFIVGYGLDYDGYGRNLKDIYSLLP